MVIWIQLANSFNPIPILNFLAYSTERFIFPVISKDLSWRLMGEHRGSFSNSGLVGAFWHGLIAIDFHWQMHEGPQIKEEEDERGATSL
ncbi:hypothetical protein K1719_006096 [Acacia pycnantha]|nr:hypothetical protein K1719_006096 [Acacia pycnantha]